MKKFNWKLLLVVVMVLVLVVCVVACNNDKNNNKKPNKPSGGGNNKPASYVEQKAFMDDLYDVTKGIGNEGTVGSGQDLYLDIDLGVALGTRSAATASDGKRVNLGIALKGVIDRSTTTGDNTALEIKLSRTNGTILDLFYVAADNAMYVEFGGQKTTVNIDLIGLDDILFNGKTGLLNKNITLYVAGAKAKDGEKSVDAAGYKLNAAGDRVDGNNDKIYLDEEGYQLKSKGGERVVKSQFTVKGLIDDIAGTAGKDFEVEDLIAVIVEKLGGLGDIGGMLGTLGFTDKQGNLDLYAALHNDLVCSLVNIPESENTGNNHKAIISLGPNSTGTIGSMLGGALGSLGLGDKDGLDVGISFKTAQDGALDGSLTVSADFVIDSKSPAHEFVEQSGNKDLFPFVELSFNSLKFAPAAGKSVAPANKADYANDYRLSVDEHIQLKGFQIAGFLAEAWPTDIIVSATANLDLKDAPAANKTELYAMIQIKHMDPNYREEYLYGAGIPIELSYKAGKLTLRTDAQALILNAPGAITLGAYDMLLSKPIGNMIAGLLPEEQKEAFMEAYWETQPDEKGENGKFNANFQGIIVNNLTVKNVIDMIKAPKTEEPETPPTSGDEPEEPAENPYPAPKFNITTGKGNILTTIMYAIQLIDSEPGKLTLASKAEDGLLGTVFKFGTLAMGVSGADWNREGLIKWAAGTLDSLLLGFTSGGLSAASVLKFDGIYDGSTEDILTAAIEKDTDNVKIGFDFTKGFDFDIAINLHKDPEIALYWTSRIGLGANAEVQNIKDRLAAERVALEPEVERLAGVYDQKAAELATAQATYNATSEYITFTQKQSDLGAAESGLTPSKADQVDSLVKEIVGSFLRLTKEGNKYPKSVTLLGTMDKINNVSAFWLYMRDKYLFEQGDTSVQAEIDEAYAVCVAYWEKGDYSGSLYPEGKGEADLKSGMERFYTEVYKVKCGQQAKDYVDALNAAHALDSYKDYYFVKLPANNKAQFEYEYALARFNAYAAYVADNSTELAAAVTAATEKDNAYNSARTTFDQAAAQVNASVEQAYEQAVEQAKLKCEANTGSATMNVYDYLNIEQYCKYYAANKVDGETITESVVAQKLKEVTDAIDRYKTYGVTLAEDDVKAIAEAYSNAYNVTVEGKTIKAVSKTDTIKNAVTDYLKYYAGNKQDSTAITNAAVTEKLNAVKAVWSAVDEAQLNALAEAYAAAYDVTITDNAVTGETKLLTVAQNAQAGAFWFEFTL